MKALKLVSSTLLGRTGQAKLCGVGLGAAILVAFCGGPLRASPGTGSNPGILPPNSTPGDLSYPEWHVAWWTWVMSMPQAGNPLLNVDDEADLTAPAPLPLWLGDYDASAGNSGHFWFLAEAYATVERKAMIPAGKTLCFPLQNHMAWGWPAVPAAELWMRTYLAMVLDTADISCEVDGVAVQHLERYRHQSPAVPMVLPENNMPGLPPGQYGMMVDDGYYLVLAPLSVGTHTIHWISTMELIPYWDPWQDPPAPPYPPVRQEVTYHITVVPSR
jgi:hypothetical protein